MSACVDVTSRHRTSASITESARAAASNASYASKSAFADFRRRARRRRRRRRSSPRAPTALFKMFAFVTSPSASSLLEALSRPSRPSRPSKPPSDREKYTARVTRLGLREEREKRCARESVEKRIIPRRRRPRRHGEKARPAERYGPEPERGEGHLVAHAPAAVARRASREGGDEAVHLRSGGERREVACQRASRETEAANVRETRGKTRETSRMPRSSRTTRTRRVPPCVPRPSRARSRR